MADISKVLEVVLDLEDQFTGQLDKTAVNAGKRARQIGQAMTRAGGALTAGLTLPIIGVGLHLANLGMEVTETESKIATIFGDMTDDIEAWAETSTAALTQTSMAARDQASVMYAIAQGMGVAEDAAFDMATASVELAADFSSFFDLPVEEAFAKIRSGMTGEFESLKSLGIVLNQGIIEQTAYTHGLAEMGAELDMATKAQATLIAITERSGEAVGDVARTQDSATNTIRQLQARFGDMKNELSLAFIPVIEELIDLAQPLMDMIMGWADAFMEMSPEGQKTVMVVIGIVAAIGPLLMILGQIVIAAPAIGLAVTIMFGPWGLVIAAVVAGVMLVIKYWDEIKYAAELVYVEIMKWFEPIVAWFTENAPLMAETWNTILGWIMDFWERWGPVFTAAWNMYWEAIKTFFSVLWDGIKTAFSVVFELLGGILKTGMLLITGDWEGAWDEIKETAQNIWDDISGFIERSLTAVYEHFLGWFDDIKGAWSDFYTALVGGSIIPEMTDEMETIWLRALDSIRGESESSLDAILQLWGDVGQAIGTENEASLEIIEGLWDKTVANITTESEYGLEAIEVIMHSGIVDIAVLTEQDLALIENAWGTMQANVEAENEASLTTIEENWDTTLTEMGTITDERLRGIEERFADFSATITETVTAAGSFRPPGTGGIFRAGAGTRATERMLIEAGQVPWTPYHGMMGIPPFKWPSGRIAPKGGETNGDEEAIESQITETMESLNDHLIESFRELGESIVSGDIGKAIGDAIDGVGDILAEHVTTRITAMIDAGGDGGGGLFSQIVGSLGGGIVGGLFSVFGGLFGRKKRRSGQSKADSLFVEVTNTGDIAEAQLNITKQFLTGLTAVGINEITASLHYEAQRINAS